MSLAGFITFPFPQAVLEVSSTTHEHSQGPPELYLVMLYVEWNLGLCV